LSQMPIVLVPCLLGSPRLYTEQLPALWQLGPVSVATHYADDNMAAIADRILATAPTHFALVGLSMGGYLAFEIMRRAGHRVTQLALLNTSALPDTAEQARRRSDQIASTEQGNFTAVTELLYERWVRPARRSDPALRRTIRQMAAETGPAGFVRQQTAIMNRPDSRPGLAEITIPTVIVAGAEDEVTPPERASEIADRIAGADLRVIPDCGHLSTLEKPAEVTRVLVDWLGQ
jgi:pimeloyl-ACP methyl ester carboxylesterase